MNKTLEQLENSIWPEEGNATSVMQRCLKLRKVAIGDLTVSDIKLLISQKIGLRYVLPLAIEVLKDQPLIEADYY